MMISCALVCDAVIGNVQEKSMKAHGASNTEVVLYSYAIGFVYLLVALVLTGNLWPGFAFCTEVYYGSGLRRRLSKWSNMVNEFVC